MLATKTFLKQHNAVLQSMKKRVALMVCNVLEIHHATC
jgi:hypothetical protein